ncbi:MAG: ROK family protein [Thermoleophilaceae bacterium]|nr:ROK family protein [Thermoleophilaceae bacterium]
MARRRVIGIDAGGTKLLGGVVDGDLMVEHRVHRLWRGEDRREVIDVMADAAGEARAGASDVAAVGFGIPAQVDFARGVALASNHLPLNGVAFREVMAERLGLPVAVDNDANAALLGEMRHGAARGSSEVALLTLGTGVGGALALGGSIYRGRDGIGVELGHIPIDLDGPPCPGRCDGRGCLEALVAGPAIAARGEREAREDSSSALAAELAEGRAITGAHVTELAHDGDQAAMRAITETGRLLGIGLVAIVNLFAPQVIVMGGGAMRGGDLLLDPAREVVAERALEPARDEVRVVAAELAEEAGMIGAAELARDLEASK